MATIGNDPGGRKRILFYAANGARKTVRLGKASVRDAEHVCRHVDSKNPDCPQRKTLNVPLITARNGMKFIPVMERGR